MCYVECKYQVFLYVFLENITQMSCIVLILKSLNFYFIILIRAQLVTERDRKRHQERLETWAEVVIIVIVAFKTELRYYLSYLIRDCVYLLSYLRPSVLYLFIYFYRKRRHIIVRPIIEMWHVLGTFATFFWSKQSSWQFGLHSRCEIGWLEEMGHSSAISPGVLFST